MTSEKNEKKIFRSSFNFMREHSDKIANATNEEWLQLINEFGCVIFSPDKQCRCFDKRHDVFEVFVDTDAHHSPHAWR